MRFTETYKEVPIIEPSNYGSAGIDSMSVNMGLVHSLCVAFLFGALTGNSILTVYSGATKGAKTTPIAFTYRLATGAYKATDADGLGDLLATDGATSLTLTAATFQHKEMVIELQPDQVVISPGVQGQPWVTFSIDSTATTMNVSAQGIADPRYATHGQVSISQ